MGTSDFRPVCADRPVRAAVISLPGFLFFLLAGLLVAPLSALGAAGVRLTVDGRTLSVPASSETVREALKALDVTVSADDEVTPALDERLSAETTIRVARVTFSETTAEVKIPFGTVVRPASRDLHPYHPTVSQDGRVGLKRVTYRVKTVDGQAAERTILDEKVIRQPLPRVVVARTPQRLGSRGAYAGARVLPVLATAYDPGAGSCGKYADGSTCNGKRAGYGIIAVDPSVIPLGTKLYVPGYGYGIAADVGGAIKGNRIDLGFNSRSGAMKWGKKWIRLSILD